MLVLFKKIRQQLLSENRFSKYLIYAVGEILLVMIGILLALQVNNWNEQRKLEKEDLQLCHELLANAVADSAFFQSRVVHLNYMKRSVNYIFETPELRVADSIILHHVASGALMRHYGLRYKSHVVSNFEDATNDLLSSVVKNEMRRYSLQYDYVAGSMQSMNDIIALEINPFNKRHSEKLKLMGSTDSLELLHEIYDDKDLQNAMHLIDMYLIDAAQHLKTFESNNKELIHVLRQHINTNK